MCVLAFALGSFSYFLISFNEWRLSPKVGYVLLLAYAAFIIATLVTADSV